MTMNYLKFLKHLDIWHPEAKHLDVCLSSPTPPPPKFDNRVRIAMAVEYFLRARAGLTILPASACLTLPTIEPVLCSEHSHFTEEGSEAQRGKCRARRRIPSVG